MCIRDRHSPNAVFLVGERRDLMGMERELLNKVAVVHQQSVIWTENLLIGHPLGTQRDRFKYLSAVIEKDENKAYYRRLFYR